MADCNLSDYTRRTNSANKSAPTDRKPFRRRGLDSVSTNSWLAFLGPLFLSSRRDQTAESTEDTERNKLLYLLCALCVLCGSFPNRMNRITSLALIFVLSCGFSRAETPSGSKVLFDFSDPAAMRGWQIEDDGVMGGVSKGTFTRDRDGYAIFSGKVSLENDGGFSSVQCYFDPIDVSAYRTAVFRVRGDGKSYRFIVESEKDARHHYVANFKTTGEWQEIRIPLRQMYPVRRGDRLDLPDYPGKSMAQVRFMIANGRAENFRLQIANVRLE